MARKVVVSLVDDFDGKSRAEETVHFAVDGVAYEIDLSVRNAGKLRGVFEAWTPSARKVGRVPRGRTVKPRSAGDGEDSAAIRKWAAKNGHKISTRGRISADIIEAFHKSNM